MARRLENDASASKYRFPLSPGARFVRATPHRAARSILACPFAFFGDKYARARRRESAREAISLRSANRKLLATAVVLRVHNVVEIRLASSHPVCRRPVIDNRRRELPEEDRYPFYEFLVVSAALSPARYSPARSVQPPLLLTLFNAY